MIQIGDVVVSFDVLREKFLCDLDACQGICCIEGDAGAPVELDEVEKLEEVLPLIWDELSPEARTVIKAVVIAPSKRLTVRVGPTSTNPYPVISIR